MAKDTSFQRVFLGVSPSGWENLLTDIQQQLRTAFESELVGFSWLPAVSLHSTLLFLGHLPRSKINDLHQMLMHSHFPKTAYLKAQSVTLFGQSHIVLLLDDLGLTEVYQFLFASAESLAIQLDIRPFRPHITLGKLKNHLLQREVRDHLALVSTNNFMLKPVKTINLYQSFPQHHYEIIRQYHL